MKKNHRHGKPLKDRNTFQRFARTAARATGRPVAFGIALGAVVIWAILGPIFHFSDTWQLVINTATTIVTFLMVFLIQNTQNRDSEAVQIKLDELLRATHGCHNAVLDIEELSEVELDQIKRGYSALAKKALKEVRNGKSDLGIPEMEPKVSRPEGS
jgi:low affinity Fe/Cu permease